MHGFIQTCSLKIHMWSMKPLHKCATDLWLWYCWKVKMIHAHCSLLSSVTSSGGTGRHAWIYSTRRRSETVAWNLQDTVQSHDYRQVHKHAQNSTPSVGHPCAFRTLYALRTVKYITWFTYMNTHDFLSSLKSSSFQRIPRIILLLPVKIIGAEDVKLIFLLANSLFSSCSILLNILY